jgi:hypothetical protein
MSTKLSSASSSSSLSFSKSSLSSDKSSSSSDSSFSSVDYMVKTIIIGDSGIGKSSLLKRLTSNDFTENHYTTVCLLLFFVLSFCAPLLSSIAVAPFVDLFVSFFL